MAASEATIHVDSCTRCVSTTFDKMKEYKVVSRTLFGHPTAATAGLWGENLNDVEGNEVEHCAGKSGEAATQGTPVPGGLCKEEEAVPLHRPNNPAEPSSQSHKINLINLGKEHLDKSLETFLSADEGIYATQLLKEYANVGTQKQGAQDAPKRDISCTHNSQASVQDDKEILNITPAFRQLFLTMENLSKHRRFRPANPGSGAGVSACTSAPNKPLATTGLPSSTSVPGSTTSVREEPLLRRYQWHTTSTKRHAGATVTPASAPDEAQVIPVTTKSEEIKLVAMHLRHILLGTLTKDVGELVLSSYKMSVERFCHDAARLLEKRLHHQGEGLQMHGDIKGRQFEDLSGLVMRRWVLMIRVLERGCKRRKRGEGSGTKANLGSHTWG
ncbi:hypothetical protein L211DRAFT_881593 [Terfezia boudieri ATCC MYA-4762]|uniref:Uncharacterized protein n=1 Tax=Terfezia boudieri ATCC MYA-4762 TaxID=1051890 RepID=A0A3N4M8H0_9PEZI|nr:hypothetical protein L211DRAFT_881593 [Terfezia boudieri ATCC MYA-4762]